MGDTRKHCRTAFDHLEQHGGAVTVTFLWSLPPTRSGSERICMCVLLFAAVYISCKVQINVSMIGIFKLGCLTNTATVT